MESNGGKQAQMLAKRGKSGRRGEIWFEAYRKAQGMPKLEPNERQIPFLKSSNETIRGRREGHSSLSTILLCLVPRNHSRSCTFDSAGPIFVDKKFLSYCCGMIMLERYESATAADD